MYLIPTLSVSNNIKVFDVNPNSATFETFLADIPINRANWSRALLVGDTIYAVPYVNTPPFSVHRFIMAYNISTGVLLEQDFSSLRTVTETGWQSCIYLDDKIYFIPRSGNGILEIDPATFSSTPGDGVRILGNVTGLFAATPISNGFTISPENSRYVQEFRIKEPFYPDVATPDPYRFIENLYSGSSIQRFATKNEDYEVRYIKSGADVTSLEIEKLKPGVSDVTVNVVYAGF